MASRQQRSHGSTWLLAAAALAAAALLGGCGDGSASVEETVEEVEATGDAVALSPALKEGRRLFERETFGGNGRTCLHCHSRGTGTISPEDVQEVFDEDPDHPLFKHDGSDDFQGGGTSRIREHATILVQRRLPLGVKLACDPTAATIVVARGVPTTLDTPALDPTLMLDGRAPTLFGQAKGAILGHAQAPAPPANDDVDLIVEYEKSSAFFSSHATQAFAQGGSAPALPQGHTAAQKRGRLWFEPAAAGPTLTSNSPRKGLCAGCHSGPLLNEANGLVSLPSLGLIPQGSRFQSVRVAEFNAIGNQVFQFVFQDQNGAQVTVESPDPGRALVTGNFNPPPAGQLSQFKIPNLRGIKKTAPYFHDNSAKTLEDVVNHYSHFFAFISKPEIDGDPPLVMTEQDKHDIVAYLKLL
jgi:cytochrome c peroxidase